MKKDTLNWFVKLFKSSTFTILTGALLIISGLTELLESSIPDFEGYVKAHHGLIVLGISHIGKSIVHIFEGTNALLVSKTAEELEEFEDDLKHLN